MKRSLDKQGFFKGLPNKKTAVMLASLGMAGCGGGGGSETQGSESTGTVNDAPVNTASQKKITGTIQAIGSYIQGSARLYDINNPEITCDEGETDSQGIWKYESDLSKCPEGTDLGVSVIGKNSDNNQEQEVSLDVSDETKDTVQIANDITTTVVKGLRKDTGIKLEESSNSSSSAKSDVERFAEVLGVQPEQMRRNYMKEGDNEFGEKLSAYTTLKKMWQVPLF